MAMLGPILAVIALASYWVWRRKSFRATEPPLLPGGWPLVGHAPMLLGNSCKLWNTAMKVAEKSYDIGGVAMVTLGPRTAYIITDPDDCCTVVSTCFEKDGIYNFAKPWLGEGLVTGKVSNWKHHRKLMNQAFTQVIVDGFLPVFNNQARKLVKNLFQEVGKGPFNHWAYTRHNALETICLTALGVDFSDHTVLNSEYVEATEQMLKILVERFQKFWWHSPFAFRWSNLKKRQDKCVKILHNMSNTVLQRKKNEINGNVSVEESVQGKKFKVFLDLLLELAVEKGQLTDRQIREQIDATIVGGYDTVANVLMYTMILLGSYPDLQEKAYTEIREVFGESNRDVEKCDLSQLVYLEAVLKESMRFFTIAPVLARWLDKDVKLKNCTLSAGRSCFLFMFGIHRHPIWGPDANQFKPERWLDPTILPENPNAFVAFSIGRRMCIGKTFAFMSMKTTLAHLMRRYRISADHSKLVLKLDVMLKPASGYFVSIDKRT